MWENNSLRSEVLSHSTVIGSNDLADNGIVDIYTSNQQSAMDKYKLDEINWFEVTFEEVFGESYWKLALHKDWIEKSGGYEVGESYHFNLPEQGIYGLSKVTGIKHIIPQKQPEPENEFYYKPVTGVFVHRSDDVIKLNFEGGASLEVTNNHPIYSSSKGEWVNADKLESGEKILCRKGEKFLNSIEKLNGVHLVYNLEIQDFHNFLVGQNGIVVHNNTFCNEALEKYISWIRGGRWSFVKPKNLKVGVKPGCSRCKRYHVLSKGPYKGQKVWFDENNFPLLEQYVYKSNGTPVVFSNNALTGYLENILDVQTGKVVRTKDFKWANDWLKANKGQLGISGNIKTKSTGVEINGKSYTWHHHQDGINMILVPSEVHNFFSHTGAGALIRYGLKAAFGGPIFNF